MSTMSPFREDAETAGPTWTEAPAAEQWQEPEWEPELWEEAADFETALAEEIPAARLQWQGASAPQLAFMRAVYERHVAIAKSKGRRFVPDLPPGELEVIEGRHRVRKDAAQAARALLAEARAALTAQRLAGTVEIGINSAYRPAEEQLRIWQSRFPAYYRRFLERGLVRPGDHSPGAVDRVAGRIAAWIAAPGYSDHQNGIAVDFGTGPRGAGRRKLARGSWFYTWLRANANRFGFHPYEKEPWHWEYRPQGPTRGETVEEEGEAWFPAESDVAEELEEPEWEAEAFVDEAEGEEEVGAIPSSGLEWPGASAEELRFMRAVYDKHVARSKAAGATFTADLPPEQLGVIEGKHQGRKDAAEAARAMLAAARAAIAGQGLADKVRIGIISAYRPASRQFVIWQGKGRKGGFPYYYRQMLERGRLQPGDYSDAAVAAMAKEIGGWIAAPGYSNHQDGLAIDFGTGAVGKSLGTLSKRAWFHKWLVANAQRFGFHPYHKEAWHWTYRGPAKSEDWLGEEEEAWSAEPEWEESEVQAIPSSGLDWPGKSEAERAFMRAVYDKHVQNSRAAGATFTSDLPPDQLAVIEGAHQGRKDAAAAARAMLADARAALASAGLADKVRIGIVSAYRPASLQFTIWQGKGRKGGFPYYYRQMLERGRLRPGDYSASAVAAMAREIGQWVAAPGYSNHQDGLAIDFGTGAAGSSLGTLSKRAWFHKWLVANAHRFGFRPYEKEAWHWTYRVSPATGTQTTPTTAAVPSIAGDRRLEIPSVPLLASHRGNAPALVLRWNEAAARAPEVDVVVHLHGYSHPRMTLPKDIEPFSGLDLGPVGGVAGAGRSRPTLTVLPRAHFTGRKQKHGDLYAYEFPALLAAKDALPKLVQFSLEQFAAATGGTIPRVGRLILTAHSGGGAPLMWILRHHDPHEVHAFDALYTDPAPLAAWAIKHIRQDRAGTPSGALRVFYGGSTKGFSRRLRDLIAPELDAAVADRYRVEASTLGHWQIPRQYGWRVLADAAADVPNARREPAGQREAFDEDEWTEIVELDEAEDPELVLAESAYEGISAALEVSDLDRAAVFAGESPPWQAEEAEEDLDAPEYEALDFAESGEDESYEPELWAEEEDGEDFESVIPSLALPPVAFEAADLGSFGAPQDVGEGENGSGHWPDSESEEALAWLDEESEGPSPFSEGAFEDAPELETLGDSPAFTRRRLPFLLAGPIVRQAQPDAVWFWVACSEPIAACTPQVTVYDKDGRVDRSLVGSDGFYPLASGPGDLRVARLGERLWVALVRARPKVGSFPWGRIYGYNLDIRGKAGARVETKSLGLNYAPFPLPTFVLDREHRRIAQASCRRPGGFGPDAFQVFSKWLSRSAADIARRPSALILTGDQIYADDVAYPLFKAVRELARQLCGYAEQLPTIKGPQSVDTWTVEDWRGKEGAALLNSSKRKQLTGRLTLPGVGDWPGPIGLTTEDGEGHLLSFAEFAAMYVLVWNEELCKEYGVADPKEPALRQFTDAVADARRVLANTATYMVFDDHEITDDWNLDAQWVAMTKHPTARRIIANGLAAYWAFQGWGNDPSLFDPGFADTITTHLDAIRKTGGAPGSGALAFDKLLHDRHWSFVAATTPPALCVDIRTRREFPEGRTAVLSGPKVWAELVKLSRWRELKNRRGKPLLIVLPTPLLGHPSIWKGRDAKKLYFPRDRYEGDFELYGDNAKQRFDLIRWLHDELAPASLVIFSGDVHFGSIVDGLFVGGVSQAAIDQGFGAWALPTIQLTSSSIKNIKREAFVEPMVEKLPGGATTATVLRGVAGLPAWPLFSVTGGDIGEFIVNMHENDYKKYTEQLTIGLRADTKTLEVQPSGLRRTFLYENNFCVATVPDAAGQDVRAEFVMVDERGNARGAASTLATRGMPMDFLVRGAAVMTPLDAAKKGIKIGASVASPALGGVLDVLWK